MSGRAVSLHNSRAITPGRFRTLLRWSGLPPLLLLLESNTHAAAVATPRQAPLRAAYTMWLAAPGPDQLIGSPPATVMVSAPRAPGGRSGAAGQQPRKAAAPCTCAPSLLDAAGRYAVCLCTPPKSNPGGLTHCRSNSNRTRAFSRPGHDPSVSSKERTREAKPPGPFRINRSSISIFYWHFFMIESCVCICCCLLLLLPWPFLARPCRRCVLWIAGLLPSRDHFSLPSLPSYCYLNNSVRLASTVQTIDTTATKSFLFICSRHTQSSEERYYFPSPSMHKHNHSGRRERSINRRRFIHTSSRESSLELLLAS